MQNELGNGNTKGRETNLNVIAIVWVVLIKLKLG